MTQERLAYQFVVTQVIEQSHCEIVKHNTAFKKSHHLNLFNISSVPEYVGSLFL